MQKLIFCNIFPVIFLLGRPEQ